MRNAVDASYARPSAVELVANALDFLCYTGNARPDLSYLAALRNAYVAVCFVQETYSSRSQEGYQAGVYDAQFADARVAQRAYPADAAVAYVVADGNRYDPNSNAGAIADYGQGIAATSQRPFFFYGNRYAVNAAMSGAQRVPGAICLGSWVPSTWDANRGSDLLVQEANFASPIADTDLNSVYKPYGAWGQGAPMPPPTPTEDDDMPHVAYLKNVDGTTAMMLVDGGFMTHDFGVAAAGAPYGLTPAYLAWRAEDDARATLKSLRYDLEEWSAVRNRTTPTANVTSIQVQAIADAVAGKITFPTSGTLQLK